MRNHSHENFRENNSSSQEQKSSYSVSSWYRFIFNIKDIEHDQIDIKNNSHDELKEVGHDASHTVIKDWYDTITQRQKQAIKDQSSASRSRKALYSYVSRKNTDYRKALENLEHGEITATQMINEHHLRSVDAKELVQKYEKEVTNEKEKLIQCLIGDIDKLVKLYNQATEKQGDVNYDQAKINDTVKEVYLEIFMAKGVYKELKLINSNLHNIQSDYIEYKNDFGVSQKNHLRLSEIKKQVQEEVDQAQKELDNALLGYQQAEQAHQDSKQALEDREQAFNNMQHAALNDFDLKSVKLEKASLDVKNADDQLKRLNEQGEQAQKKFKQALDDMEQLLKRFDYLPQLVEKELKQVHDSDTAHSQETSHSLEEILEQAARAQQQIEQTRQDFEKARQDYDKARQQADIQGNTILKESYERADQEITHAREALKKYQQAYEQARQHIVETLIESFEQAGQAYQSFKQEYELAYDFEQIKEQYKLACQEYQKTHSCTEEEIMDIIKQPVQEDEIVDNSLQSLKQSFQKYEQTSEEHGPLDMRVRKIKIALSGFVQALGQIEQAFPAEAKHPSDAPGEYCLADHSWDKTKKVTDTSEILELKEALSILEKHELKGKCMQNNKKEKALIVIKKYISIDSPFSYPEIIQRGKEALESLKNKEARSILKEYIEKEKLNAMNIVNRKNSIINDIIVNYILKGLDNITISSDITELISKQME